MRAPIRKALVARLTTELEQELPKFKRTAMPKGTPPIWAWRITPTLTFFILLQPFKSADKFALELAWSEDSEFPWESICQSEVCEPRGRERYPRWEANKEEVWDLAPEATAALKAESEAYSRGEYVPYSDTDPPVEQVLSRVELSVVDAIQKLMQKGLPFLRRVADHREIVWPVADRKFGLTSKNDEAP